MQIFYGRLNSSIVFSDGIRKFGKSSSFLSFLLVLMLRVSSIVPCHVIVNAALGQYKEMLIRNNIIWSSDPLQNEWSQMLSFLVKKIFLVLTFFGLWITDIICICSGNIGYFAIFSLFRTSARPFGLESWDLLRFWMVRPISRKPFGFDKRSPHKSFPVPLYMTPHSVVNEKWTPIIVK